MAKDETFQYSHKSSNKILYLSSYLLRSSCNFLVNQKHFFISFSYFYLQHSLSVFYLSHPIRRLLLLSSISHRFCLQLAFFRNCVICSLLHLQDISPQLWILESKHSNVVQQSFCNKLLIDVISRIELNALIIMYKFKTSRDQQQATLFTLAAHKSLVVVKAARLQASHLPQAQSRLLLQFNIHENHDESSSWSALQHELKARFDEVIAGDLLPFCSLKIHVYILQTGSHLQSTISNAIWACLLMHGVPMRRSVFHYEWQEQQQKGKCVLDLNNPATVLSSESNNIIPAEASANCSTFKQQLTLFLSREWSR